MSEYKNGCEGWHKNMVSKCMCGNLCKSCAIKYSLEKERDDLRGALEQVIQEMYHFDHDRAMYWDDRMIHLRLEGGK